MTQPAALAAGAALHRLDLRAFHRRCRSVPRPVASSLVFHRCAWDLPMFARHVMGEYLARAGKVAPPCAVDDWVYGVPPARPGTRRATVRRLLLTGRGIGKTTKLKVRAFHGMLYGFVRVGLAVGATDDEAMGWVSTLRTWATKPTATIRRWFPELQVAGNEHKLVITTRFGTSTLIARGWSGSIRGLNVDVVRPDAVYLDDIEKEENSKTIDSRTDTVDRLRKKILPLESIEGGAEFWWLQTPVHHDGASARVVKGDAGLKAWAWCRLPLVRQWPTHPDAERLWQENLRIYHDRARFPVDRADSDELRAAASDAHFEAHREVMAEGAVVLDGARMPIHRCYQRRSDIGETAWATEYEVSVSPPGAGVLRPDTWPRFERRGQVLAFRGDEVLLKDLQLEAHYDPSDGGDDGALVVVAAWQGCFFVVHSQVWTDARISRQIEELPEALRFWVGLGLRELQWEPTQGSASEIKRRIEQGLRDAQLRITVKDRHSTERKESRIVATLEPLGARGEILLPDDLPGVLLVQAHDFDPSSRTNRDDWLDALQRAIERHQSRRGAQRPKAATVRRALDAFRGR